MDANYRSLRIGDRVRIVRMPREFAESPGTYLLHDETRELYEHLIATAVVLSVTEIDGWGVPWIEYTWFHNSIEEFHSLGLNHDGLESVT